jgi:hypothetical protein
MSYNILKIILGNVEKRAVKGFWSNNSEQYNNFILRIHFIDKFR